MVQPCGYIRLGMYYKSCLVLKLQLGLGLFELYLDLEKRCTLKGMYKYIARRILVLA